VNDTDGRIQAFKEGGWEFVEREKGMALADSSTMPDSPMGSTLTKHVGGGVKAVLMKIKKEWFDEDKALKAERINDGERDILSRRSEGQYGEIKVER